MLVFLTIIQCMRYCIFNENKTTNNNIMKKIYFLSLLSLLLAAFPSCNKELEDGNKPGTAGGRTLFTATMEGLKHEETGSFWSPNSKMTLVMTDKSTVTANLISGTGTENGSFMATVPAGKAAAYAVYPQAAFVSANADGVTLGIPATQHGYVEDCKFAAGKVAVGNKVALKNAVAILPITLKAGADVCKLEISSVDGSALAGDVSVNFTEDGLDLGAVENAASTISLDVYGAGTFYFAVLPGITHAQGVKVSYYLSEDPYTAAGEVLAYGENAVFEMNALAEEVEVKATSADKIFYVSVEGAGTMDGKSWANAMSGVAFYEMLTSAIYVAPEEPEESETPEEPALANEETESTETPEVTASSFNGATFNFAAGTYDFGETPELTYSEVVSLDLIGGFDASTGERDITKSTTTFTGNETHRIFNFGTEMQVSVDGINFEKGKGSKGGAFNIFAGSFEFKDCNFSDNIATDRGGALRINDNATVSFKNCNFTDNKIDAEYISEYIENRDNHRLGGAIYSGGSNVMITIDGGTFSGNCAWRGGALCSYNAKIEVSNATFTENGEERNYNGGAIFAVNTLTLTNCTLTKNVGRYGATIYASGATTINGCRFEDNHATGNAGAIAIGMDGKLTVTEEVQTIFKNNSCDLYGGALEIETRHSGIASGINGALFIGNTAKWGGAAAVYGENKKNGTAKQTSRVFFTNCIFGGTGEGEPNYALEDGGAIYHEDQSEVNITKTLLVGNYAGNHGGAVAVHGWDLLRIYKSDFIGNHATSGGAIYTEPNSSKYASAYIDACSFDANYIKGGYGTTMNINGIDEFCLNNTSVRGSYNTTNQTGDKASWISLDGVQNCTSISNSTIIGNTQYGDGNSFTTVGGAGLVALWGDVNYFTNSIIVPESADVVSVLGAGSDKIDLTYTHYSKVSGVSVTDKGENTTGLTPASLGSLSWSEKCWMWNGQINGTTPAMMSKDAVLARLDAISPNFVKWCDTDIMNDQLGVSRGEGSWWPGAYQNNN